MTQGALAGRLAAIVASVERRLAERQARRPEAVLERAVEEVLARKPRRSLAAALAGGRRRPAPAVIAEIKRASPAAGRLAGTGGGSFDPEAQARAYVEGGAAALSVVTEPDHFQGDVADLGRVRPLGLPVLRKDFIVSRYQLLESVLAGADAVLLIARIVPPRSLARLVRAAEEAGLEPFVEVNDRRDVEAAVAAGARLIGVNHRDLDTFTLDPGRFAELVPLLPEEAIRVAASGIATPLRARELHALGADAVLVGEALMRSGHPAGWLRQLAAGAGGEAP
ncbi:indole-3-glycerol-phosphate synthase [Thermaerobacter sp. PB12/4term]|uniref:indole-3-glycerol phosphate synthase TrpC n=1 Tax=Thermaerobacter sp. PB12/4term TaxID=2293838 RepID=UPI000E325818|nr:indole-3-glycerol phosphate synthase TrpC [Thermaerobacter sp. PB12/4term]QIA27359.1 indole-3-glycerol-phosphate synthase [Thermaerobacter sp. PB12/4term]